MVERYEREYGVRVVFWRISRIYNGLADELAGFAAGVYMRGPVRVEYVQQAQFPRVIDVFHRMHPQLSDDEMEADST